MWNMLHVKNGYGKESGGGLVGLHISRRLLLPFFALLIPQARCDGKKEESFSRALGRRMGMHNICAQSFRPSTIGLTISICEPCEKTKSSLAGLMTNPRKERHVFFGIS